VVVGAVLKQGVTARNNKKKKVCRNLDSQEQKNKRGKEQSSRGGKKKKFWRKKLWVYHVKKARTVGRVQKRAKPGGQGKGQKDVQVRSGKMLRTRMGPKEFSKRLSREGAGNLWQSAPLKSWKGYGGAKAPW